jgi:hypothetical protein
MVPVYRMAAGSVQAGRSLAGRGAGKRDTELAKPPRLQYAVADGAAGLFVNPGGDLLRLVKLRFGKH